MGKYFVYDKVDKIWVAPFGETFDRVRDYTDSTMSAKRFNSEEEAQNFIDEFALVDCVVDSQ